MNILQPIDTAQSIDVFVRNYTITDITVELHEKQSAVVTSFDTTGTITDDTFTFPITFDFTKKNQRFFVFKIYNRAKTILLHRGIVYVTQQTDFEKYSVLNSYYTQIDKPKTTFKTRTDD